MATLSVIIPIYNTGKKLNKCLKSLITQTFEDWQCILLNDNSSDITTLNLLDKWSHKDKRFIRIDNKENQGIEKNRLIGLQHACGEYLMFMDHDDWLVSPEVVQSMVDKMEQTKTDILLLSHSDSYGPKVVMRYIDSPDGLFTAEEVRKSYYASYFGLNRLPVTVWAKMYRTSVVKEAQLHPSGLRYADDECFNVFVFPYAKTIYIWNYYVYNHRWGGYSSTYKNGLEEYKKFYWIRLGAIEQFDFPEGKKWLDIEIKNVLIADLNYRIESLRLNESQVIAYLQKEMSDKLWGLLELKSFEDRIDPFISALFKKDYRSMYSYVDKQYRATRYSPKKIIKNIARNVLKHFC